MKAPQSEYQEVQQSSADNRFPLGHYGDTKLYLLYTPRPWTLPVDAFTIPVGMELGFSGGLASALREHLGPKLDVEFRELISSARSKQPEFKPETPLLFELPEHFRHLLGPRYAFVATAFSPDARVTNAAKAAAAVARRASEAGIARVAISLLGSGSGGLSSVEVVRAMLQAILSTGPLPHLRELTVTTLSEEVWGIREELARLAERSRPAPGQPARPLRALFDSDQKTAQDCLEIGPQAETFARLLTARDVATPLSLGLFGNWGTGKTFFMQTLEDKVNEVQKERAGSEKDIYVDRVVQIWFNAWHYADSNLWASLATGIFDGLTKKLFPTAGATEYEKVRRELRSRIDSNQRSKEEADRRQLKAKEERQKAAAELARIQAERAQAVKAFDSKRLKRLLQSEGFKHQADKAREAAEKFGLSPVLQTKEDAAQLLEQMRALDGRLHGLLAALGYRFSGFSRTLVTLLIVVTFCLGVALLPRLLAPRPELMTTAAELVSRALQLSAIIGGALAWVGRRMHLLNQGLSSMESIRQGLATPLSLPLDDQEKELQKQIELSDAELQQATEQMKQADERIAEAQAELQRINAGGLVYDFLGGRLQDPRYTQSLGLISTIRQDFEKLGELLTDWLSNKGQDPVDRIILYIDDLDRCHPDRVVEVLQAVHLLLAFNLFIVVVGVDARWLERSLYKAYVLDPRTGSGAQTPKEDFSPHNYLEKIFQVPFSLTAMNQMGFQRLVSSLVEPRPPKDASRTRKADSAEPSPSSSTPHPKHDTPQVEPSPAPDQPGPHSQEVQPRVETLDEGLLLCTWERQYLQSLHPFISTPRLTKRLINIYRLLRVRATGKPFDFARFIEENGGEYRAALLLLALNIGHPRVGGRMLRLLTAHDGSGTWDNFLQQLSPAQPEDKREPWALGWLRTDEEEREFQHIAARLALVSKEGEPPELLEPYKQWAAEVGRYSFDWNLS